MSALFLPQELIRKKRDGLILNDPEIGFLVQGITDGSLTDAQLGAFAMAVFKCGMTMDAVSYRHLTLPTTPYV